VQTLARFPKPLTFNGITCDCFGNITVAIGNQDSGGVELLNIPRDGGLPQRLLTYEEVPSDYSWGVRDIAVSPDGKELYVLGGELGTVSQYLFPWGSQPTQVVLEDLDWGGMGPAVGRIFCDRPG
jgi:hypothetical protein